MGVVLDIIIIAVFVLTAHSGYRKGLFKTVMNFVSLVISAIIANIFAEGAAEWLYDGFVKQHLTDKALKELSVLWGKGLENFDVTQLINTVNPPPELDNVIGKYGFDLTHVQSFVESASTQGVENVNNFVVGNIVEPVARSLTYFLSYVLIFMAASIILGIVMRMINNILKLPGLNMINRVSGLILGAIFGIIVCYLAVWVISFALPYIQSSAGALSVNELLSTSYLYKMLYENAPFNLLNR